jgi:uncharacterized protein (DUF427 family)
MIRSRITVNWDDRAIEQIQRDAIENVRRRLERVTCPAHGTRVKVVVDGQGTASAADELCCDELKMAIQAALR